MVIHTDTIEQGASRRVCTHSDRTLVNDGFRYGFIVKRFGRELRFRTDCPFTLSREIAEWSRKGYEARKCS